MGTRRPPSKPLESEKGLLEKVHRLQGRRRQILALPPQEALDRILADPEPVPLVHSIPEEDFLCLVHDIGPEDALPLLAMASSRQIAFLTDQRSWSDDRFDLSSSTRWWNLLFKADPQRFARWLASEQRSALQLYCFRTLDIRVREHDQDPSEFGEGFFTLDNTLYLRFRDIPAPIVDRGRLESLVNGLLEVLAAQDYADLQNLLLESSTLIPAETEEELYRLRNVRLAERGFVPFEEAVALYHFTDFSTFRHRASLRRSAAGAEDPTPLPPDATADLPESLFTTALRRLENSPDREALQWAFAALCNQLIVADRTEVRGRADLAPVVRKATGFLSIGLEVIRRRTVGVEGSPYGSAVDALHRYRLHDVFRLGYNQAAGIRWEADRWLHASWFVRQGLPITFWGEEWAGVLGGILLKRPRYFNRFRDGVLYREFERFEEVDAAADTLRRIQGMDALLSAVDIQVTPDVPRGRLSYRNVLLTLWARNALGLTDTLAPIPLARFRPFFVRLFPESPSRDAARGPDPEMKAALFSWLTRRSGIPPEEISAAAGEGLEALFGELESEYGQVEATDLDPRFVTHFLLAP